MSKRAPKVPSYVDIMNVNIGKSVVPTKTKCQPSGLENPPPLNVALMHIISGPSSHIPSTGKKTSDTRFATLPDTFRAITNNSTVVVGRRAVRLPAKPM